RLPVSFLPANNLRLCSISFSKLSNISSSFNSLSRGVRIGNCFCIEGRRSKISSSASSSTGSKFGDVTLRFAISDVGWSSSTLTSSSGTILRYSNDFFGLGTFSIELASCSLIFPVDGSLSESNLICPNEGDLDVRGNWSCLSNFSTKSSCKLGSLSDEGGGVFELLSPKSDSFHGYFSRNSCPNDEVYLTMLYYSTYTSENLNIQSYGYCRQATTIASKLSNLIADPVQWQDDRLQSSETVKKKLMHQKSFPAECINND
uniref:Uncharacterized protein n=1 Tax=Romanomermis culicivorax TaxID=13658 RepID=A0A915KLK7_ROMCU